MILVSHWVTIRVMLKMFWFSLKNSLAQRCDENNFVIVFLEELFLSSNHRDIVVTYATELE